MTTNRTHIIAICLILASGAYLLGTAATVEAIGPLGSVSGSPLASLLIWLVPTWLITGICWFLILILIGTMVDFMIIIIWLVVAVCQRWGDNSSTRIKKGSLCRYTTANCFFRIQIWRNSNFRFKVIP